MIEAEISPRTTRRPSASVVPPPMRERLPQGGRTATRPVDMSASIGYVAAPLHKPVVQPRITVKPRPAHPGLRLEKSERRLMSFAIGITGLICVLLVAYLAVYANLTRLGIEDSQARMLERSLQVDNDRLRLEYAELRSPERVSAAAVAQKMSTSGTVVDYINPKQLETVAADSQQQPIDTQATDGRTKVAYNGTANESSSATGAF